MGNDNADVKVGIIIVSHGDFGAALLRAAENILGPIDDCAAISVDVAHEVSEVVRRLNDAAVRLDTGGGVLILTDMFGGTPTNLALSLLGNHRVEVVTGVNVPMLIKVFSNNNIPLYELARVAGEAGKQGIVVAGTMLRQKTKNQEN